MGWHYCLQSLLNDDLQDCSREVRTYSTHVASTDPQNGWFPFGSHLNHPNLTQAGDLLRMFMETKEATRRASRRCRPSFAQVSTGNRAFDLLAFRSWSFFMTPQKVNLLLPGPLASEFGMIVVFFGMDFKILRVFEPTRLMPLLTLQHGVLRYS